jgi:CRISPR-associated endonuclease Csn1
MPILGIDLGSGSLGTALVCPERQEILFAGVRVFPAGVTGNLDEGKEESRTVLRRMARLARRQTQRRQRRLYKVFRILQRMQLLPPGPRVEVLCKLQRELELRYPQTTVLPWYLRARALDHPLERSELGRALYHLAQRRGFLSNRVGGRGDAEKRGIVKDAIRGLRAAIAAAGKRTIGEYMASLTSAEMPIRNKPEISEHHAQRSMCEDEFRLIWEAQAGYHTEILTETWRARLHAAIFHQRPLKDQSYLVGECELDPSQKRAPLRLLAAQRFRVLGFVNNLRIRLDDGNDRKLTPNERTILLDQCEKSEKLSFAAAKRALGLVSTTKFTIEEGGEKNVPVNLVSTRLRAVLGERWDALSPEQKDDLVEDVGDGKRCQTDEALEACARNKWGIPADAAEALGKVRLPDGYGRYSLEALRELLPSLEAGNTVEEAIRAHPRYEKSRRQAEPLPLLPPVKALKDVLGEIRNPAVLRSLTELRKTVNAIVRRYGKPDLIRVELARDLKKSKTERQKDTVRNRDREKLRQEAVDKLREQDPHRFANPRASDIEKYLLVMESKWWCPYSGRQYGFVDVFGDHPTVDVEHIIPRSRSLDDSFLNKTLAYRTANMEKGDRTPREWLFQSDRDRYDAMIDIVKGFDARFDVGKKLRRFSMELSGPDSLLTEFTQRQLQETRYASKLACRYLGVLYGGTVDAEGTQRVSACAGQVTAKLRDAWDLNQILNPERKPKKSRDDHRHHAVDAITVALSSGRLIRDLATAAGEADRLHRRTITLPVPWTGFSEQARKAIESIQVSHRPVRRLSGPLHEDTFYSRPRQCVVGVDAKGKQRTRECVHYRVPVVKLESRKNIEAIVDGRVREAVAAKFDELGGGGNRFEKNWPVLRTRAGGCVPIKRVRVRKSDPVVQIGKAGRERFVITGSNHHAEILKELDPAGRVLRYTFAPVVTMLEAMERKRQGVPVVQRDHGPGLEFLCTLSEGDLVEGKRPQDAQARLWKVRTVDKNGRIFLSSAMDARKKDEIKREHDHWEPTVNSLFGPGAARKVYVTHTGEVIPAND